MIKDPFDKFLPATPSEALIKDPLTSSLSEKSSLSKFDKFKSGYSMPDPLEQKPIKSETDSAFDSSIDNTQKLLGRGVQVIGEASGIDSIANYGKGVVKQQDMDLLEGGYTPEYGGSIRENYNEGGIGQALSATWEKTQENAATSGAALAGGALAMATAPFSAPLAAGVMGATTAGMGVMGAGEVASEMEDKGVEVNNAYALLGGAGIMALERIGMGSVFPKSKLVGMTTDELVKQVAKVGGKEKAKVIAKEIGKRTAGEIATELPQEGISVGAAKLQGAEYTGDELLDRVIDTAAVTTGIAGPMSTASTVSDAGAKALLSDPEVVRQQVDQIDNTSHTELYDRSPQYREMVDSGVAPAKAKQQVSNNAAMGKGLDIGDKIVQPPIEEPVVSEDVKKPLPVEPAKAKQQANQSPVKEGTELWPEERISNLWDGLKGGLTEETTDTFKTAFPAWHEANVANKETSTQEQDEQPKTAVQKQQHKRKQVLSKKAIQELASEQQAETEAAEKSKVETPSAEAGSVVDGLQQSGSITGSNESGNTVTGNGTGTGEADTRSIAEQEAPSASAELSKDAGKDKGVVAVEPNKETGDKPKSKAQIAQEKIEAMVYGQPSILDEPMDSESKPLKATNEQAPNADINKQSLPSEQAEVANKAPSFPATHELDNGTPVVATDEENVWQDEQGDEYLESDVSAIKPEAINETKNAKANEQATVQDDSKLPKQDEPQVTGQSSDNDTLAGEAALEGKPLTLEEASQTETTNTEEGGAKDGNHKRRDADSYVLSEKGDLGVTAEGVAKTALDTALGDKDKAIKLISKSVKDGSFKKSIISAINKIDSNKESTDAKNATVEAGKKAPENVRVIDDVSTLEARRSGKHWNIYSKGQSKPKNFVSGGTHLPKALGIKSGSSKSAIKIHNATQLFNAGFIDGRTPTAEEQLDYPNLLGYINEERAANNKPLLTENEQKLTDAKNATVEADKRAKVDKEAEQGLELTGSDREADANPAQAGIFDTGTSAKANNRKQSALRKSIDEMSEVEKAETIKSLREDNEGMQRKLYTSHLTGLPNKAAYDDATKKKYVASVDVDSLKWFNDNLGGHAAGDALLKATAEALRLSGADAYHLSGDEFAVQSDSKEVLEKVLLEALEIQGGVTLEFTLPDGAIVTVKETGFSHSIGEDYAKADAGLQDAKNRREKAGLRAARGREPGGISRQASKGGEANQSDDSRGRLLPREVTGGSEAPTINSKGDQDGTLSQSAGVTNDQVSAANNKPRIPTSEQRLSDDARTDGIAGVVPRGRKGNAGAIRAEGQGNGLPQNTGLAGQRADVKSKRRDKGDISSNGDVSADLESIDDGANRGVSNYDLREKSPIALTPAKRRDINRIAEEILKKSVNDITEADKEVLRQYTGSGGLDLKASQDKGAGIFNQHYTSYETIKGIYSALDEAGLVKGKALEPSVGSGNFIGMMPDLEWSAVDIDKTNTDVVSRLYPAVKVSNESYETFKGKNFDLIVSNVPFASFSSLAREHAGTIKPAFKAIHNFFFAQSIDKLKDGGVMAFMTSTGTMDGITEAGKLRRRIIEDMDVIGAYRLPMGTQKANASTDVMIDVIFLQKRPKGVISRQPIKNEAFTKTGSKDGHRINQYFIDYPSSVLGDLSVGSDKTKMGRDGLIVTGEADYSKMRIIPQEYDATTDGEKHSFKDMAEAMEYAKKNDLKMSSRTQAFYDDGVFYGTKITFRDQEGGALFGRALQGEHQEKMSTLIRLEGSLDPQQIAHYQERYKQHPRNDRLLKVWAKKHLATARLNELSALFDTDFNKSEIFDTQVRFQDSGKIEIDADSSLSDRIESLEDKDGTINTASSDLVSKEDINTLLNNGKYARVSDTRIQNARLYYSGNIYQKLSKVERVKPAAQRDKQKTELEAVKPPVIPFTDISIKGNESWLPPEAIATLGRTENHDGGVTIGSNAITDQALLSTYNRYLSGEALVKRDNKDTQDEHNDKLKIAQRALTDDALPLIKEYLADSGMEQELIDTYNKERNFFTAPVFDGSSLKDLPETFRGEPFKLMKHQQEGAERAIYNKRGVIAFAPGLGKTPTAIIVIQQLLNKGVVKKPLFIVPANTIPQWEETAKELYPNAKVFQFPKYQTGVNKGKVKDWAAMNAADKEKMANDLKNSRYDYTFISTNMAQKITVPSHHLDNYIDDITKEMSGMEKPDGELTKSQIKAKETRLAKMAMLKSTMRASYSGANKLGFDMKKLGFDAIVADEVQYYKNIGMQSSDSRGGIGASVGIKESWPKNADGKEIKTGDPLAVSLQSSRSYDFRFKTRYISEMNNGNNVFLLTGTPTPNKPMELMTLLQHLNVDILKEYGISSAEEFTNEFFVISDVEGSKADGSTKLSPELTSIKNIAGLKAITTRYIDYRSPESAKDLKRPKQVDIRHIILKSDTAEAQFIDIKARLLKAIEDAKKKRQGETVSDMEAIIAMYGAGRDASIDQRLYTPSANSKEFSEGDVFEMEERSEYSKIAKTVELVAAQVAADDGAGQLVFLDRLKFANSSSSTHEDIRDRVLSATGLAKGQVVFVSGSRHVNPTTGAVVKSGPKPEKLQQIISDYNTGRIKVLIGNTSKLGVGVDLQVNTTDIYQIDLPYRPDEIEQRNNRGVRQGNRYDEVRVHSFTQAGTFDEMSERIIANKQGFNDVFWKDQESSTAAIASQEAPDAYAAAIELEQDPIKKRKLEIERDISRAERISSEFDNKISGYAKRIRLAKQRKLEFESAITRIDSGVTPVYDGLPEKEKSKKVREFKKRMIEQRIKHTAGLEDVTGKIDTFDTDKRALTEGLANHKANIEGIRRKYITDGVVDRALIEQQHPELMPSAQPLSDAPLFSKKPATTQRGLGVNAVEAIVKNFRGKVPGVKITVHSGESTLPDVIQQAAQEQGAEGEINGVYHEGEVHIVASKMRNKQDVERVIFHEVYGHYGARKFFGKDIKPVFNRLYMQLRLGGVKAVAEKNGIDLDAYFKSAKDMPYEQRAQMLVDELLAHLQEKAVLDSLPARTVKAIKEFIGAIRARLRQLGFKNLETLGETDLFYMLKGMRKAVKGEVAINTGTRFSRGSSSIVDRFSAFFSGMGKAIDSKIGKSVNAKLLASQLQNPKIQGKWGIKAEEVEWTGIVEWLQEQDGKVTKQEIQEFIESNQVQVEEVELSTATDGEIEAFMDDEAGEGFTRNEAIAYLDGHNEGSTKYEEYTVKGEAKNYRELLLTLPEKEQSIVEQMNSHARGESYQSSHFDEKNILAHVRYDERKDADGNKVLFIHEVQSDWHQEGRKEGYASSALNDEKRDIAAQKFEGKNYNEISDSDKAMVDKYIAEYMSGNLLAGVGNVPNAPFKGNAWIMLAMKRMIRHAAENGFDKVAWATGEQSADLYSLDKQIKDIKYEHLYSGDNGWAYTIEGTSLDGDSIEIGRGVKEDKLSSIVGKDVAQRIIDEKGRKLKNGQTKLSGLDLKIGGEGMRSFYDKTMPNLVNKYVKKWGAKVGDVDIKAGKTTWSKGDSFEVEAANGENNYFTIQESYDGGEYEIYKNDRLYEDGFDSKAEARLSVSDGLQSKGVKQHGFDVTDKMRDSAMKGQPLFSRKNDTTKAAIKDVIKNSDMVDEVANGFGKLWSKTKEQAFGALTLGQTADAVSKILPMIKDEYIADSRRMNTVRNKIREAGGDIAKRRRNLGSETSNQLSRLQHETTIGGVNPAESEYVDIIDAEEASERMKQLFVLKKSNTSDGRSIQKWTEEQRQIKADLKSNEKSKKLFPALRAEFLALPKEAQNVFNDELQYHIDRYKQRHDLIVKKVEDAGLSKEASREIKASLELQFTQTLKKGAYFPLSRFGDYWLQSTDSKGDKYFDMFESERARRKHIETIEADGFTVEGQGKNFPGIKDQQGVSSSFLLSVDELMKDQGDSQVVHDMRDQLYQLYLESLPESSAQKHLMHRTNRKGFNEDQMKAFSNKVVHDSNSISRLMYSSKMLDTLNKAGDAIDAATSNSRGEQADRLLDWMQEYSDNDLHNLPKVEFERQLDNIDQETDSDEADKWMQFREWNERLSQSKTDEALAKQQQIVDSKDAISESNSQVFSANALNELRLSHAAMVNANTSPIAAAINSLGFVWYLGATPAAAIVNLTQTPMVSLPVMAAKLGWKNASSEMGAATKDFFTGGERTIKNKLRNEDERKAYQRWHDEGLLDETISHDLSGYADAGIDSGAFKHRAMGAVSYMFHHAEVANREITAIATYRAAINKGKTHNEAVALAEDVTWKSHLDYGSTNRARFMRGNWARVLTQFKAYSQGMTHLYVDAFKKAFGSATAEEKAEARKMLTGLLTLQFGVTGALGMPMASVAVGIAQAVADAFGDEDEPYEVEAELRQLAKDNWGQPFSQFVFKGAFDAFTPYSIHSRLSLSSLWLHTSDRELSGISHQYDITKALLGPAFSIAISPVKAMDYAKEGHYDRALEAMLPKALRDIVKGVKYSTNDYKTFSGYDIKEATVGEVLGQMVGFSSSEMSDIWAEQNATKNIDKRLNDRRKRLIDNLANAEGGKEKLEARREIRQWNKTNLRARITSKTLRQSNSGKERRARDLNNGMYRSKRNRETWDGYNF